jgi:hypothetical protein
MHNINIKYPGTFVQLDDDQQAAEIDLLFISMDDQLINVAISLSLFEEAMKNLNKTLLSNKRKSREQHKRFSSDIDFNNKDERDLYALMKKYSNLEEMMEKENRKEKWHYEFRLPFLYAHLFLYSLDNFEKLLNVIPSGQGFPQGIDNIREGFNKRLPSLQKIRNSALHIEDRIRRYETPAQSKTKIKMNLQPVRNNIINGNFSALIVGNLNGNKLSYTIDDGSCQEIEISIDTLNIAIETFQSTINLFTWEGPARFTSH